MRSAVRAVCLGALLLMATACTGERPRAALGPPVRTADPALVSAAGLDRCTTAPAATLSSIGGRPGPAGAATRARNRRPDVLLPCLGAGAPVRLSALRGPALVNVWSSDCGPCRAEAPLLQAAYAAAGGRLLVLGIDLEPQPDAGLRFAAEHGLRFPSVSDQHEAIVGKVTLRGTPTTYAVDDRGAVTGVHVGPFPDAAAVRTFLRARLEVVLP